MERRRAGDERLRDAAADEVARVRVELAAAAAGATPLAELAPTGSDLTRVQPLLEQLAGAVAERVVNPVSAGCCGFAGDRGWLHPELPAAALRPEVAELAGDCHDAYVSSNRTCEIGLSRESGHAYRSVVHLLEEATRPRSGS